MGMRVVWAATAGAVAGFLICAFIVYPPHSGWNENLDLPAWVQAVGSIVAIVSAGLFPLWHERTKTRIQRRDSLAKLTALAYEVAGMADAVADAYRSRNQLAGVSLLADRDEYEPLVEALSAFPIYILTDRHHLSSVIHMRRYVSEGNRLWKAAVEHGEEMFETWEAVDRAKSLRDETQAFAEGVARFS